MNAASSRSHPARAAKSRFQSLRRLCVAAVLGSVAAVAGAQGAAPADFPKRAVRIVVPFPAGGATDLTARLLAGKLSEAWGQPVVVENKAGASGMIGTEMVARAPADGYTILVGITTHIQNPSLYAKVPYDPYKDFEPVSQVCLSYLTLAVHPDFPAKDLKEFLAYVKANPGSYSFGSFGIASSSHIVGERFGRMAGLPVTHVPYKGSAPLNADLIAGQIRIAWPDVSTATQFINSGRLRPLAVTGPKRAPMLPNVPTLAEAGFAGFEPLGWVGVFLPAGTPKPIVDVVAREVIKATNHPDVRTKLQEQTLVPVGSTPEAFAKTLREDGAMWAKMVKDAGISPQ